MTDEQIAEAAADLDAMKALKALEDRLRADMPRQSIYFIGPQGIYRDCGFCGKLVLMSAYCCERCGWKVAASA